METTAAQATVILYVPKISFVRDKLRISLIRSEFNFLRR